MLAVKVVDQALLAVVATLETVEPPSAAVTVPAGAYPPSVMAPEAELMFDK